MHLVDGGALDNLPMGYNHNDLPVIGASLASRAKGHPEDNVVKNVTLPEGNLDTTSVFWSAVNGYTLLRDSGSEARDYLDKTRPQANQFMLSLPTWDLTSPGDKNSLLGFGYDPKTDPTLDAQSRQVTREFLRSFLDDMRVPGARGTNFTGKVPEPLTFEVTVEVKGKRFDVKYEGGDLLKVTPADGGWTIPLPVGEKKIESMYLDHQAFGDLEGQLAYMLTSPRGWLPF